MQSPSKENISPPTCAPLNTTRTKPTREREEKKLKVTPLNCAARSKSSSVRRNLALRRELLSAPPDENPPLPPPGAAASGAPRRSRAVPLSHACVGGCEGRGGEAPRQRGERQRGRERERRVGPVPLPAGRPQGE